MDPMHAPRLILQIRGEHHQKNYKLNLDLNNLNESKYRADSHSKNKADVRVDPSLSGKNLQELLQLIIAGIPNLDVEFVKQEGHGHRQPKVTYKKGGNSSLQYSWVLKGKFSGGTYGIQLNAQDPKKATGYMKPAKGSHDKQVKVVGNFNNQVPQKMREALMNVKQNLKISVDTAKRILTLDVQAAVLTVLPVQPVGPVQVKGITIANVHAGGNIIVRQPADKENMDPLSPPPLINAHELAQHLKLEKSGGAEKRDPHLTQLAHKIIELFFEKNQPGETDLQEVTPLTSIIDLTWSNKILKKFVRVLQGDLVNNLGLLRAATKLFNQFQQANFLRIFTTIAQDKQELPLQKNFDLPNTTPLVGKVQEIQAKLSFLLTRKLSESELANPKVVKDRLELTKLYVKSLLAFLNFIFLLKPGAEEGHSHSLQFLIHNFLHHEDLEIAYHAQIASEELRLINASKEGLSLEKRSEHFALGMAKLRETISLNEPIPALTLIESSPDLQTAFEWSLSKNRWFGFLSVLRQRIFDKPQEFIPFAEALLKNPPAKDLVEKLEWHNPYFLRGFVNILSHLLAQPTLDPKISIKIIEFLQEIWKANKKEGGTFTIKNPPNEATSPHQKQYQSSLCEYVHQLIYNCTLHRSEAVQKSAQKGIAYFKSQGAPTPKVAIPFDTRLFPSALFNIALRQVAMTPTALPILKQLQDDPQVIRDQDRFILPEVQEDDLSPAEPFLKRWEAFKKSKSKALAIQAPAGYGKTLLAKLLSLTCALEYNPQSSPIFFFPLQRLKDPVKHLISEGLERVGITSPEELEKLTQQEFYCVCDSYDEMSEEKKVQLLKENEEELKRYPHVRFVFLYRKGHADISKFEYMGKKVVKLQLVAFNREKFNFYAWNVVEAKKRRQAQEKSNPAEKNVRENIEDWSFDDYFNALNILNQKEMSGGRKGNEEEIISNPFFLAITIDVLPYIVEKLKKEHQAELKAKSSGKESGNEEVIEPTREKLLERLNTYLQRELLDSFICVNAHRESLKKNGVISPEQIIRFQCEIGKIMYEHKLHWIAYPPKGEQPAELLALYEKCQPHTEMLLKAGLMKNDDGYLWQHLKFRDFFESIDRLTVEDGGPGLNRLGEVLSFLEKDVYDLKRRIVAEN